MPLTRSGGITLSLTSANRSLACCDATPRPNPTHMRVRADLANSRRGRTLVHLTLLVATNRTRRRTWLVQTLSISTRSSTIQATKCPGVTAFVLLGPSDSSDTGADMVGIGGLDSTSDRNGTGESVSVDGEADLDFGGDIGADSIVNASEAGLGGGLDQAEEAQLGITDEELGRILRNRKGAER